jgi:hypothetical protein
MNNQAKRSICETENAAPAKKGKETGHLDFMDEWYPIQVKQKDKAGTPDIRDFEGVT